MPRRHSLKSRKCKTPNVLSSTSITEGRSILKKRQRKPLQEVVDLHLTADTKPQTNTRSNNRRVSFAVSEVKEFRQPANEGTLWGSSYFVDIQKSSSESENTESSASAFQTSSGSCGSGLIYSQQVIVQETVSVSYSDIDESQEFREDNLSDVQSNRVCELIDVANQTDESVFQFLNNLRDPTKKSDVCREVVPTYLQHVNNERKFMDPSEMLGEFLQLKPNFPQTIPCETFERQTPTTLPYSSVSSEREFDKENSSLPMNTKNKDHASIFSEPSGISQKHPLTLCDDSFEIAKKQEIGTHCNDIKLLDWLREGKTAAVREKQKPIWINNQLGISNELKNLKHSHDHVEYDMQDCPHISKQSLKNEHEVLNNSSGDISMSFTLSNAPLLNISCTNKDSPTGTSCNNSEYSEIDPETKNLNLEKKQMLSDYNNGPVEKERLSISPKVSEACFIEKNMASSSRGKGIDNEVSSHKDKYSDVCLKRMSLNEVEGEKNSCTNNSIASNHSTGFENVTSSVSPTMVNGRILGNIQLSNQFPNCENVTRNMSSTVPDEIDLIGAAPVSNLDNISSVSLTMTTGKILDNHYISRHEPALAFKRIGSQIISSERDFNNVEDATQNFINIGSNCESTVSPITTEDPILCNSQSSRLRDVSGNKSPTIPVRQILYDDASFYSGCPINVRNKLPRIVGEKIDTRVLPAGHFEKCLNDNFTVSSHVPYFQDTIPRYSCPTNPQERVFSNVSCKNYNCSLGNLEGSEFLTESGESISDKKEISHHFCDFRNTSRLVSPTMPAERNLDKIHIADEKSDLVNDSGSVSPTMPMGRIISEGQSSSHTNCKGIIAISTSPALPAGRNLDKINRTDETSEWVNASSVSPTVSMGRIIGEGHSNPYTNYKDISAVSVSPTLPAGRILDKINRTDETSEWVNTSRSVSPTVHMGRIIGEGQSSPFTNYKDTSAVSVSPTLPAGRILDKINKTHESSELLNASRSVSPTMSMGRIIGEGQSSPHTNCKDISGISVSLTLPAGRILDKFQTTHQNSDFVNASRSVSPTMSIGRIIGQGQSSQNADSKDTSEISASPMLQAGRILGKIIKTNEPSDFANASRSVSPTMPVGRIIGQGQTGQNTGCKDNSEASASTLCAGKIVEKIHESNEASDLANISRGGFPPMPMGRIIGEMNTSKNRGFEVTHRRSVSPTTPLGRVFHNNQISCDNVELACKVVKENMDEQGDFSNSPLLKLTSDRDLESTSPLQEHNSDKLSKSSNENVPPSISKGYIAMCDKHVSLTESLEKMCIDEKYAVEEFIENDKEFPHHNPRKQVEINFNAQGTSKIVDTNVFHKTCNINNSLVATDSNVLKETQDDSDCKNVKIGFYNCKTRMAETDNKNLGEFVRIGKDTVDKIEKTSFNLNEGNTDLSVIRINDISTDFSENTGSVNNPAAVIWKRNRVETVELDIEKDFIEQKKGGNSLFLTTDYRNCSNIKLKEVPNIEENCDDSERININMNSDSKMNVGECFVNSQIVCNMKSTEKENDTHYSNSSTSSKVECEGSNNVRFCETNNPGGLVNNGSQTNCKNTNVICIDDKRDNEEVMPCSDARDEDSEEVESDIELNIVSSPVKFHISKDNSFSSEAIEVDNTFRNNGELIRNVKSAKGLVVSTNECTDEKNDSCNEKTNIHINKEETNEENKHSKIVETVSKINRPSICISGIDYIDWKSSLDVTNALVNSNNKSRPVTIFPGTQSPHFLIPESSISIVKTGDNNYSSEMEGSVCSESSLISPSNLHNNEFDGANDILIKSFRNQGRNDLLKERSTSSFSFHNEKSNRIIETPCRIGIEVNSNKLKIPQYVQPVSKLMNVDEKPTTNTVEIGISVSENKPPILGVSPVQLEDDRSVNSSTGHLRSMPSDILQPQDFIERVSSSNSPGTSAQTDIVIHDEMIKGVKKTVELPSNTNEENKTEMQEIHPHTYCSKSTDSVICIGAKNDFVLNESNTIKEDIKMNIELLADIQGNKLETKEVHTHTPSKMFAPIICTHAKNDIVINESKSFKGDIEKKVELSTGVQVNEAQIHSCVPSKSTAQINFSDAESEIVINENKTINGDVKRNIELPTGIQVNKKEMKEIHPHKPSKRSAQINSNDEQWSPLQKKTRFSPQIAPNLPTRLSYYESFFSKENQTLTSTSFKRNYSYAFGYKSSTNDLSSQVIPPLSFEMWLQEQSKKCNWKVEHISSSKINFFFLEKKVKVYVEIDPSNLNLSKIDVKSHLKGNNTAIFLHNLFLKRLKLDTLKVRFPSKNDIPALIDFISTEEEFILDFAQDWLDLEIREAIQMKENFCAEFEVTSLLLSWLCIIKIDLSSWNGERLHSRYIKVFPVIGEINDAEIKRLIRAIPGGPHLLKDYVSHLHNYILTKEKFEGKGSFLAE